MKGYLSVHIGLFGILVTVILAAVFVASVYVQEWAFESTETNHPPTSCDPVRILGLITSDAPFYLRVCWQICGVVYLFKHLIFAFLYDRVYSGFLNKTAIVLRALLGVLKLGESMLLLAYILSSTLFYTTAYTPTIFYSFLYTSFGAMSVMLVLEVSAVYTRIKHRGHYNTGSLHCKVMAYLTLLGLWVVFSLCGNCCHEGEGSSCNKDLCHNISLTTSFLTIPGFLVFHGTDCLDFIRIRCCIKLPSFGGYGYQAVALQSE